jgi:peptidoglycan/xylan/chitin deacetylase (PgdA/CDA1 family)
MRYVAIALLAVVVALAAAFILALWLGQSNDDNSGLNFDGAPTYTVTLDTSADDSAQISDMSADEQICLSDTQTSQQGDKLIQPLGDAVAHLPYATAPNKRFVGWYTAPDSSGALIQNNDLSSIPTDASSTLYARFEAKPTGVDKSVNGLPILMYHYFFDPAKGETGPDANYMNVNDFDAQMKYLTDNNFYFPTWDEAVQYLEGNIMLPTHSVVVTSDDGEANFYSNGEPIIAKYASKGARITGFVIGKDFDTAHLSEYPKSVVDFQSHSYDLHHAGADGRYALLTTSYSDIQADVEKTYELLGTKTAFCYPGGKYDDNSEKALRDAGVQIALAIINERAYPGMDMMAIPRCRMSQGITMAGFEWTVD